MKTKQRNESMRDIVYAAYQTHTKCVTKGAFSDETILSEWNRNLPGIELLWTGIVQGILTNTVNAQRGGHLPPLLVTQEALLPGLGGDPAPSPGSIMGRRLAERIRGRMDHAGGGGGRSPGPIGTHLLPPELRDDVSSEQPGLAIGRCTENCYDEGPS